jgi:hypothetical protein
MTTTLVTFEARVNQALADAGELVFDEDAVEEAIRSALAEYNLQRSLAGLDAAILSGLDGAASTTLDAAHDIVILLGACGYAVSTRGESRAESFELGGQVKDHISWAEKRLAEFRKLLASILEAGRLNDLRTTDNVPFGAWEDDEDF